MRNRLGLICGITLTLSSLLLAHHGNASFDTDKKLILKATVTQWVWANPHCFLKFDVSDNQGNLVHWVAETSSPPDMTNRGWSRLSFKAGDQVTVTLQPVKNGQPVGRVLEVKLPSGQILSANSR